MDSRQPGSQLAAAFAMLRLTAIVIPVTLLVSFHTWSLLVSFVIAQYCWRWDLHSELEPPDYQAWKGPYEISSALVLTVPTCILTYHLLSVHPNPILQRH